MRIIFLLSFLLLTVITPSLAQGKVYDLNPRNYRMTILNPQKYVFVYFYAPWCVTCPAVNATWEELGATVAESGNKNVIIGRVNCGLYTDIAKSFEIKSYPTFLLFTPANKTSKNSYQNEPKLESFLNFLRSNGAFLEAVDQDK